MKGLIRQKRKQSMKLSNKIGFSGVVGMLSLFMSLGSGLFDTPGVHVSVPDTP